MKHAAGLLLVVMLAACGGGDDDVEGDPIDAPVDATIDGPPVLRCITSVIILTVPEGGTRTFTARLSDQPSSATILSFASSNSDVATVDPIALTYTPASFDVPQTLTVTGVEDADTTNSPATITCLTAANPTSEVAVTVTDND
jgi:hypothetical protein